MIHGSCMDDSRALELGVFTLVLIVYLASLLLGVLVCVPVDCGIDYGPSAFCDRSQFFLLEVLQILISLIKCHVLFFASRGLRLLFGDGSWMESVARELREV